MALGGRIPAGSCVYSTLKPCNMCAGTINDASGDNAKVFWARMIRVRWLCTQSSIKPAWDACSAGIKPRPAFVVRYLTEFLGKLGVHPENLGV